VLTSNPANEIGRVSLAEALELTLLIARKDPRRRVAARWLRRYLEEHSETAIDEAALAASCLAALRGYGQVYAAQALRAMAERGLGGGLVKAWHEVQAAV
jgi:hypothetical protein